MMTAKKTVLTYDGLKKLEAELQELKIVRRKDVAEKIKEARGQGDLSENAEYDAAKEEQAEIEARIINIENMLRNVQIIDEDEICTDVINIGNKVKLFDEEFNEEIEYVIVGSTEANPINGTISNESPIGVALLGKAVGERIEVIAPDGSMFYKILEIGKN
ncbi:MAG: transcription elongation factor GreA [Defluviitaleaceae bacterium]|nr:transcription elongation factor GreA [Defluviitaleaceae bacterium]